MLKVAIVGATGYSGLELIRLLLQHPMVTIQSLHSTHQSNIPVHKISPHLQSLIQLSIEPLNPKKIMNTSDLVFFATPAGISTQLALPFIQKNFPVIDLSGDFRLNNRKTYEKWYQKSAPKTSLLNHSFYSLADIPKTITSNYIANPGCFATAALLAIAPLTNQQFIQWDSLILEGKSGLSGAGKKATTTSHFSENYGNFQLYKVNQHQHIPEIIQQLKIWNPHIPYIQFTTALLPINRGIFMSIYCKVKADNKFQLTNLNEIYHRFYKNSPFIRIHSAGHFPNLHHVVGSNFCDIGFDYNPTTKTITLVSVIDNLIKGASGQAIQNMNLLFNLPVTMGLLHAPIYL